MALKNPVLFWLLIVFALVNLVDAVSAYWILPGEANPLFLLTGSIIFVDVLKILFVAVMVYFYRRNIYASNFSLFMLVLILLLGSLVTGIAAWGNIMGAMNPEIVEIASQYSTAEKVSGYFSFMTVFYLAPFGLTLFAFKLYEWTRNKAKIDKEYFKKLKWWHL